MTATMDYPAELNIDFPERPLDRLSTAFRPIWTIPVGTVLLLLGNVLVVPVALLIVVRGKYPRWWFDFNRELTRFTYRVTAYAALMTDRYPSTDEEQSVHLQVEYPDVERDLNRWMPLVKWFLAIPHIVVLTFLGIGALFAAIGAWFSILFTGRYPRALFDYVEGVLRWGLRVQAYAALLTTDEYPPFRLS